MKKNKYIIQPNIEDISLIENVQGLDHKGKSIFTNVVQEKPTGASLTTPLLVLNVIVANAII